MDPGGTGPQSSMTAMPTLEKALPCHDGPHMPYSDPNTEGRAPHGGGTILASEGLVLTISCVVLVESIELMFKPPEGDRHPYAHRAEQTPFNI